MKKADESINCWEPENVIEITVQVSKPGGSGTGVVSLFIDKDDTSNLENDLVRFFEDIMGEQVWHASVKSTRSVYYPGEIA